MKWSGKERRRFVRAKFPCKIVIYTPQEHTLTSHTEDIGGGGIRVVIEEKLEAFSTVGLEIFLGEDSIKCKGKIVWVVEKESQCHKGFFFYDIGIEFVNIKDEDRNIIKSFVDSIVSNNQ